MSKVEKVTKTVEVTSYTITLSPLEFKQVILLIGKTSGDELDDVYNKGCDFYRLADLEDEGHWTDEQFPRWVPKTP